MDDGKNNIRDLHLSMWLVIPLAIIATLLTFGLRLLLDAQLNGRPTLIIFTLPVMLGAYLGGWRVGFLATAVSYSCSSLFLFPPEHSLWISSSLGRWDLCLMVLSGLAISIMNEALHRTRRQAVVANLELCKNEERLRSLVNGGKKYAITTLDTTGCVNTWNEGAERIQGYRAQEVIGQHISRFFTPEDVQLGKPDQELKAALEQGEYEADGWSVRKDGSKIWVSVLISSLRDSQGEHLGFSKIVRDLTDVKRVEEQARNFFSMSLELLCIIGTDGYFKVLNPAWQSTLGYTQEEMIARPFWDFIHPADLPATRAAAARLSEAAPLKHFENRYCCKDGSYRTLLWKISLSDYSQLMYCAASDITQLKQTEEEIADLNAALQLRNLELTTANKELEAFSYSVSHDLRAPLRSIDGFSKAILEDYSDKLDSAGQSYLQRVRASSQKMGQLIDDLLKLSQVSRSELSRESTDLSQIAREVVEDCRASSPGRDVQVQIADGLTTTADPRLMRVVLTNLLGNAWKFTGKTEHAVIEVGCSEQAGQNEFFVRDNGSGFDMSYVEKLFGAFQRLHTENEFPGTGIGLATIQRIIHRHGGSVRAIGNPSQGATFCFTLPNSEVRREMRIAS